MLRIWLVTGIATSATWGSSHKDTPGRGQETDQIPEPVQLWRVEGAGRGLPAADSSTVYFLTKQHEVVAVDTASGMVRWKRNTGESGGMTWGSRLVLTDSVLVAGDYDVVAFDRTNGALRWRFSPRDGYGPGIYLGSTVNGLVFTGSPSGRIYAIDETTGDMRWSVGIEDGGLTTVFQPAADRDLVVAGYTTFTAPSRGGVIALDASTGRQRWRAAFNHQQGVSRGSGWAGGLALADPWVIATGGRGELHAFDRTNGSIRWSLPAVDASCAGAMGQPDYDFRPVSVTGRTIFAGSLTGCIEAYDLHTRVVRWRRTDAQDGSVAFSVVSDEDTVYVPYVGGRFRAFAVSDGKLRWQIGEGRRGFRWPPMIVGSRLFVASSTDGFFAFDRKQDGELKKID
jgi:outer membrane protein assembly factor BamB